jgi:hypothetical protein
MLPKPISVIVFYSFVYLSLVVLISLLSFNRGLFLFDLLLHFEKLRVIFSFVWIPIFLILCGVSANLTDDLFPELVVTSVPLRLQFWKLILKWYQIGRIRFPFLNYLPIVVLHLLQIRFYFFSTCLLSSLIAWRPKWRWNLNFFSTFL